MKNSRPLLVLLALSLTCAGVWGDVVYDIPINNEISGTARVLGQTFTAPTGNSVLDDFTIRVKDTAPATSLDFKVSVWSDLRGRSQSRSAHLPACFAATAGDRGRKGTMGLGRRRG